MRLLEMRRVQAADGGSYLAARWEAPDDDPQNATMFRFLLGVADIDLADPVARAVGLQLRASGGDDDEAIARAVQSWTKQNIWYAREPTETFQAPWWTIKTGVGDCDDHANLVHSIARNAGLSARITAVRDATGVIRHVCAQINVAGVYRWIETTLDAAYDEPPKMAARRLRAARSDL